MIFTKTKTVLKELGISPHRSRGQNFLCDNSALLEILEFLSLAQETPVLEIGPGLGVLTKELLNNQRSYLGVEIEGGFVSYLKRALPLKDEQILQSDIRKVELEKISPLGKRWTVVGNIPYSISTDVLFWVLENRKIISRACLLFQKEFAARVAASPNSRAYGIPSIKRELYAECKLGPIISGDKFFPETKVDSQMIELIPRKDEPHVSDFKLFDTILRASFAQRRKTLLNSLSQAHCSPKKEELAKLLLELGIDPKRRAETLSLQEFLRLTERFKKEQEGEAKEAARSKHSTKM